MRLVTHGLVMTDYGFLLSLSLALFLAVDPFNWRLERIALTKHLPLILSLAPLLLSLAGGRIFSRWQERPSSLSTLRPLLALSALIIAGSWYARAHLGTQNTFLSAGLYIWVAPMAAAMLLRCSEPQRLLRGYLILLLVGGVAVFLGLAVNYGSKQVYHELEYLVPPLAVFFAFRFRAERKWASWTGVFFFLLAAILFKKNTGYLTALLVMSYLLVFLIWPKWSGLEWLRKSVRVYALLVGILALSALAAFLILHRETYLPTGNTGFRLLTYEKAWDKFLASPLWGTGFAEPGTEKFSGFDTGVANNVLPTHSDILDIMAQGGLLGLMLWLWGLLRVARLAWRTILNPHNLDHPLAPYGHMLACMSLAAVLAYAFNPIFLQPAKSMLLWTNLGFLVGISLLARAEILRAGS
jgi:O-antigen ligase